MMKTHFGWPKGKPPPIVHEYVNWLCTPLDDRESKTKTAWAAEHGVGYSTVKEWDRDDRVKWLIQASADKLNMGPERVQQVMNALFRKASNGDTAAAKLYMEHVDKLKPPVDTNVDLSDLSDEEVAELARGFSAESA